MDNQVHAEIWTRMAEVFKRQVSKSLKAGRPENACHFLAMYKLAEMAAKEYAAAFDDPNIVEATDEEIMDGVDNDVQREARGLAIRQGFEP